MNKKGDLNGDSYGLMFLLYPLWIIGFISFIVLMFAIIQHDKEIKYSKCAEANQLSSGNYLIIEGIKAELNYSNKFISDCCCNNKDLEICICNKIDDK